MLYVKYNALYTRQEIKNRRAYPYFHKCSDLFYNMKPTASQCRHSDNTYLVEEETGSGGVAERVTERVKEQSGV